MKPVRTMLEQKILVVGETCTDVYIYGRVPRLCPEAPVPVFVKETETTNVGMAGNVAANLRALGMECDLVTHPEPIIKTRFVEATKNHILLRMDDDGSVSHFDVATALHAKEYAAVVVSDYCKGFLDCEDIEWLADQNPVTFVDTKKRLGIWARGIRFFKINEREFEATKDTCQWMENLIVTHGAKGCVYKDRLYPVEPTEVMDIAGAGDTFLAALAARFVRNQQRTGNGHIEECIDFANRCARQVVQKRGTSVVEGMTA